MSRTPLPFHAQDISQLARSLKAQIAAAPHPPSHVQVLNMLARGVGARNFQHFRTLEPAAQDARAAAAPSAPALDVGKLARLGRLFDAEGRLIRWPSRAGEIAPCLWVLWSRLPARQVMHEREVSRRLDAWSLFGDAAILRREMVGHGLLTRTVDGREYRRVETEPPALALALIRRTSPEPA